MILTIKMNLDFDFDPKYGSRIPKLDRGAIFCRILSIKMNSNFDFDPENGFRMSKLDMGAIFVEF